MCDENDEIAPRFSFKPIDIDLPLLDNSISDDSLLSEDTDMLPAPIFREVSNADNSGQRPLPLVRQANPVGDTTGASSSTTDEGMSDRADRRVISPYPFSHTSQEEIEEREHLSGAFNWALDNNATAQPNEKFHFQFDYTRFFDLNDLGTAHAMECDDFSVASKVSEDLDLDSISNNPSSFWGDNDQQLAESNSGNESLPRASLDN